MKKLNLLFSFPALSVIILMLGGCGGGPTGPNPDVEPVYGSIFFIWPPGMECWVDNAEVGVAPYHTKDVEIGEHTARGYLLGNLILERPTVVKQDSTEVVLQVPPFSGIINSEEGGALQGVLVELLDKNGVLLNTQWLGGSRTVQTATNTQGMFQLRWEYGAYNLRMSKEGYNPQTRDILELLLTGDAIILSKTAVQPPPPPPSVIEHFPTTPTEWWVHGLFFTPEKYKFWRQDHKIYYSPGKNTWEVGTITDDGKVEMALWIRILKGQFYPGPPLEIRGEATAPDDPNYHATFRFVKV